LFSRKYFSKPGIRRFGNSVTSYLKLGRSLNRKERTATARGNERRRKMIEK